MTSISKIAHCTKYQVINDCYCYCTRNLYIVKPKSELKKVHHEAKATKAISFESHISLHGPDGGIEANNTSLSQYM